MTYLVEKKDKTLKGEIILPASKSITNRLLIIKALCEESFTIHNVSESDDSKVMLEAFEGNHQTIDIGHAGTAMRFLTAYLASQPCEKILTGSKRMKERPIGVLVNALRELGAEIKFAEKEGYPPLKISGKKLEGGYLEIDGSVSSQYITALLLIAPTLKKGLTLKLLNKIISADYIKLTLELMRYFGISYLWNGSEISVPAQEYQAKDITVEADWSGVSYWYQMAALSDEVDVTIHGLFKESLQSDSAVAKLFEPLGVNTEFGNNFIRLTKSDKNSDFFEFDFINNPDIAQTLAVTLCLKDIPFYFKGVETLKIKETNRILALQNELGKYGFVLTEPYEGGLEWKKEAKKISDSSIEIATYKDHRMAMAFAPIAITKGKVIICEPEVVSKSYPNFWTDLNIVGLETQEC